jgi:hypothetical protein
MIRAYAVIAVCLIAVFFVDDGMTGVNDAGEDNPTPEMELLTHAQSDVQTVGMHSPRIRRSSRDQQMLHLYGLIRLDRRQISSPETHSHRRPSYSHR